MHIPDGFLDAKTWASAAAVSVGVLGYGLRRTRERLSERQIPMMGVMAAFVFSAQMINFPIVGGTSGHLLGGALLAIVLGPWSAAIVMTAVLVIQALFFGDGGVTALGANVLNMAIIASFCGYYTYVGLRRLMKSWEFGAVFAAGWVSVVVAAAAAAVELALSDTIPLKLGLPAMLFWHAFIGIGEGVITAATVAYLVRVRPEVMLESVKA